MSKIIILTGTPGVGKTTLAGKLAKHVKNSIVFSATSLVNDLKIYSGKDKFGTKIARMDKLEEVAQRLADENKSRTVIFEGHLFCDVKIKGASVIVLREHLQVLKRRLTERSYPQEKIKENLISEAIDYCGSAAQKNYTNVQEIFSKNASVEKILQLANKKSGSKAQINLLEELVPLIKKDSNVLL